MKREISNRNVTKVIKSESKDSEWKAKLPVKSLKKNLTEKKYEPDCSPEMTTVCYVDADEE